MSDAKAALLEQQVNAIKAADCEETAKKGAPLAERKCRLFLYTIITKAACTGSDVCRVHFRKGEVLASDGTHSDD